MDRSIAILGVLLVYLAGLLWIGWRAGGNTHGARGFYLGGRTLGPWVAALAANASSSSAWSLVGTSGFAFQHGLAALWLIPGCVGGFLLNWLCIAPRVRDRTGGAVTMTELLAGKPGEPGRAAVLLLATMLTLGALLTYVAAQMQAAGAAFLHAFDAPLWLGVLIGAAMTIGYTLLGGYLAASLTDTVQGLLMAAVAVLVPVAAVIHLGGPGALGEAMATVDSAAFRDPFGGRSGLVAAGFALGLSGIALGYPGQPHAMNKYMGMAPGANMTVARTVGIGWAVVLYSGMIVLGWAGRVLVRLPAGGHEEVLYAVTDALFHPVLAGVVLAAVLAAIMSTVDSQLLVCGSCVTHDLGLLRARPVAGDERMLRAARITVLLIGGGATVAGIVVPKNIFDNVMFAWAALGSAFGPVLIVHLWRGPIRPWWTFLAMVAGGGGAITGFYWPVLAGGFADRVLAWLLALAIAWLGVRR